MLLKCYKNATAENLRLPSNMIGSFNDETDFETNDETYFQH